MRKFPVNYVIKSYGPTGLVSVAGPTSLANARRVADQANAWNIAKGSPNREIVLPVL